MKLLYILSEYLPDSGGGIISHYARILPGLVDRGHEVSVLLASKDKLDHPDYEIDGVQVRPLKSKFLEQYSNRFGRWAGLDMFYYLLPVAWAAWAQALEECDYDLVEVTDWALLFLPWVAAKKRVPVVVSLHGSCGQVDWFGKGEPRSLDGDLVRMVEAAALRGADVVHANSRANAEFWMEKTGREIRVIPPVYAGRDAADGGGLMAESGENKSYLTTIERLGGRENRKLGKAEGRATESWPQRGAASGTMQVIEQPKVGPKGEGVGTTESKHTGSKEMEAGTRLAGQDGASEPDYLASKLADSPVSESLIRSSDAPASSPVTSYSPPMTAPDVPIPITAPQALKGLIVARLQNWKGAEVLCKALEMVDGIQIEWIGGDTPWGNPGEKASEYLKKNYPSVWGSKLYWQGLLPRAGVLRKISGCSFLVVPSLWDVFNLTVAEGMEAGVPVICSKAAGAEMLIEHGRSGFLFDPAKPEELVECLHFVSGMDANVKNEMGLRAREAVKATLHEGKILGLLEKSYADVLGQKNSKKGDPWIASLVSPGSVVEPDCQPPFAKRAIRKLGRFLAQV